MPALKEKHKYSNVHQIPKIEKIVVNGVATPFALQEGAWLAQNEALVELGPTTNSAHLEMFFSLPFGGAAADGPNGRPNWSAAGSIPRIEGK